MRNHFANTFYELGKKDQKLCIVVADISPAGSMLQFREEFPDRFINTGVAEQIMIGMAAGMALRGMRPFAYTIATFALYRPFEFIRVDIGYQNLPITVVGIGGGVAYSALGGTHHAIEDISIATSIPTMSVIAPCDPLETELATRWCATQNKGPVYLRLGKAGESCYTKNTIEPFVFGKIRTIRKGTDTCILTYGPIIKKAIELADCLQQKNGESVSVVSCHTIKPLDKEGVSKILSSFDRVIVLEEHVPHGGLGSRVKELAWDSGAKTNLQCFSLKEKFIHVYGTYDDVLKAHGLTVENIYSQLRN